MSLYAKYANVYIQKQTNQQTQWWQSKCQSKGLKKSMQQINDDMMTMSVYSLNHM